MYIFQKDNHSHYFCRLVNFVLKCNPAFEANPEKFIFARANMNGPSVLKVIMRVCCVNFVSYIPAKKHTSLPVTYILVQFANKAALQNQGNEAGIIASLTLVAIFSSFYVNTK